MSEIRPCVHCGNMPRLIARPGRIPFVECTVCCLEGGGDTEAEAIAEWNALHGERAAQPPQPQREGVKTEVIATCERLASRMGGKYVLRTAGSLNPQQAMLAQASADSRERPATLDIPSTLPAAASVEAGQLALAEKTLREVALEAHETIPPDGKEAAFLCLHAIGKIVSGYFTAKGKDQADG